jgi:hypothetical protein
LVRVWCIWCILVRVWCIWCIFGQGVMHFWSGCDARAWWGCDAICVGILLHVWLYACLFVNKETYLHVSEKTILFLQVSSHANVACCKHTKQKARAWASYNDFFS